MKAPTAELFRRSKKAGLLAVSGEGLVLAALLLELRDGLHGAVLFVVEQQRLLVGGIGLLRGLVDWLIQILFGHNTTVLSETKG